MKLFLKLFVVFVYGLFYSQLNSQELPPIDTYSTSDYHAENQNWDISQAANKHIYIANNKGLLEFNGANWQLYPSPNETILRSVFVKDDLIYTGCYMEFGYWKHNQFGELIYTSLSEAINEQLIEDEQFWKILSLDHWILFQSLDRIYIYNTIDLSFNIIESETIIRKMYLVNEAVYFQKSDDGIYVIDNGVANLVTNDRIVQTNEVVNVFNHQEKLLVQTKEQGFYYLSNSALIPWTIPASDKLNKVNVYNSIQLADKSFVLGTISNGIIHLTEDGEINYEINEIKGLANNTVLNLFEDVDHNIWLGLDNGINCINLKSPFKIYNDEWDGLGTVYASKVFNENLYLGTNQGLFVKPIGSDEEYQFIEGTKGQVWCLVIISNTLFCGHNSGTFIVNNKKANLISNIQGTWDIKPLNNRNNLLLQGNYNGLNVLHKEGNIWKFRNHLDGFDISSRNFELSNTGDIFVNHEYKGIYKLSINDDFYKVKQIVKDTSVSIGKHSNLIQYNNEILYSYKDGVYKYDSNKAIFQLDSVYSKLYDTKEYTSGKLIVDTSENRLWGFSNKSVNYLSPGKLSNSPTITRISLPKSLRKEMTGYENISDLGDNHYLIGTSTGYILVDTEVTENSIYKEYLVSINSISINAVNDSIRAIDKSSASIFKNKENNIKFSFSVPEFEKYLATEYQFQLLGIYDNWSDWSTKSDELFTNLSFGNYTFNVRAKVGNSLSSNIASYSFEIEKPWYLTNLMLIIYILGVILFSMFMHTIYKRYYAKQRQKLLQKAERELELKRLENEQQLMSFENEKLKQDMESKNNELAISTMSLIKRNEFLSTIKDELSRLSSQKEVKSVLRLIDNNLNNTDDWKLFEEAFNNADKDFLKKIKSKHQSLTHNDLRLCAYLRLNLSSKEIAPLLNISPRSVEVKRYRLRKKMNLDHETSLTTYILDL
jgi:AraC family transcriptional regulator, chitin signaling transcriptional activator